MKHIIISDVKCHDCCGPVTLFAVPDKVWNGLGLTTEWVCIDCITHRLNPTIDTDGLEEEIQKQRRRFNLKRFNKFCGEKLPVPNVFLMTHFPALADRTSLTMGEVMGG